jgi:hypothetical protein
VVTTHNIVIYFRVHNSLKAFLVDNELVQPPSLVFSTRIRSCVEVAVLPFCRVEFPEGVDPSILQEFIELLAFLDSEAS